MSDSDHLAIVIERHLPETASIVFASNGAVRQSEVFALRIFHADFAGSSEFEKWNPDREKARLGQLAREIRIVVDAFEALPLPVRHHLIAGSSSKSIPFGAYRALKDAKEAIQVRIDTAREMAARGKLSAAERSNWHGLAVYIQCREIWKEASGGQPPEALSDEMLVPYAKFVKEIFESLKLKGTPQSLAKLWKSVNG